jgi:hypothetical protein
MRFVKRWALMGAGVLLIAAGAVGAVLPGHLGVPVLVIGLAIVLRSSFRAKRRFVRLQRRHPNWLFPLRRLMRREPEIVRVIWHGFLRSERFFIPKRFRMLVRGRRRFRTSPAARAAAQV